MNHNNNLDIINICNLLKHIFNNLDNNKTIVLLGNNDNINGYIKQTYSELIYSKNYKIIYEDQNIRENYFEDKYVIFISNINNIINISPNKYILININL